MTSMTSIASTLSWKGLAKKTTEPLWGFSKQFAQAAAAMTVCDCCASPRNLKPAQVPDAIFLKVLTLFACVLARFFTRLSFTPHSRLFPSGVLSVRMCTPAGSV
jgi:hypothetical protein